MWSILQDKWQEFQLRTELGLDLYLFLWSRLKTDEAIIALKTEEEGYSDEQLLDICGRRYFPQELVFWLLKSVKNKEKQAYKEAYMPLIFLLFTHLYRQN